MIDVMTVQIAIRLPDDMVAFLDKSVAAGHAPSRAALVARAVEREMRRQLAVSSTDKNFFPSIIRRLKLISP